MKRGAARAMGAAGLASTLGVALLAFALGVAVTSGPPAPPSTLLDTAGPRILHLVVGGDLQAATGEYADAYGRQAASIDGDIEVAGLRYATVAAYGLGAWCSILVDGQAVAPPRHTDVEGEPALVTCTYAP